MTKKKRADNEDDIDNDADEKYESTQHHEDRKTKIRAENAEKQAVDKEVAEEREIANFKGFPVAGETRDQLLDRIRKLREQPAEVEPELFRSEGLQKEFEAEQKAGQEAVAKAEKIRNDALAQAGAGEKNKAE